MKSEISLIIVHWNAPEILKKQLQKIATKDFQVIVIDNASEKSVDWVMKEFPSIELIKNQFNRGYAFACNQGALHAKGDWLSFLNPDVEIKQETIRQMVDQAEKQNLDACSPIVGENYQKPLPSWWSLLVEFSLLNRIAKTFFTNGLENRSTLFGGCLMIKKAVLMELGGWDERFFLWFEDSDLTKRLIENKYKTGWINLTIKHSGGQSFNQLNQQLKRDLFFHSMDVFARKHFSWWGRLVVNLIKNRYTSRKLLPEITNNVSITIPNLKKELLESFFSQNFHDYNTEKKGEEWIVVSSVLNKTEVWNWRNQYPFVRFIPIQHNYGFTTTVNIGFRVSTGNWVGTVNDDVTLSKDWLNNIFQCYQPKTGSLNPVIYSQSKRIESSGIQILDKGKAIPITNNKFNHDRRKSCKVVDATNAAAVLYNKEALNITGLFDERFGSYLEDIDLSLRLSRAGYKNLVSSSSTVLHLGQQSSKDLRWQKNWLDFKNWNIIILKNWGLKKILLNLPTILLERLRNLSGLIKNFKLC